VLKNSIYLLGLLVIALGVGGCASVNKATTPERNSNNSPTINPLQSFEGLWVIQLSCGRPYGMSRRYGRDSHVEYGFLEVTKKGKSRYIADFFVFEEHKGMRSSTPLNLSNGSILKMEGKSKNDGFELELIGEKWLLKSNRPNPISLDASLQEGGLFLEGEILGDPSCSSFLASKAPVNDSFNKNPVFSLDDILDELKSKRRRPLDQNQCIELFDWVGSGSLEVVIEKEKSSPPLKINSLLLDDESLVHYFGKTYRNWTSEDSLAYSGFSQACERSLTYNYLEMMNSPLKKAHDKYGRAGGMHFLSVGKDSENNWENLINPSPKGIFKKFIAQPPNIRWAGNYFVLSAIKSAKAYEKLILQKLQNLDSSDKSIDEISEYSDYNEFPLNFLLPKDKSHFKANIAEMHRDRRGVNTEKLLIAFNFSAYPKTLQGLKSLLSESKSLRHTIKSLEDSEKRAELNRRYDRLISEHSLAASQEIIANIPSISLTPNGFVKLEKYIKQIKAQEIIYLLHEHQANVNNNLLLTNEKFFVDFSENMAQWVAESITDGEEGVTLLNEASEKLLGDGLLGLDINNALSSVKQTISYKINQEAIKRQNPCDLLAAHPADRGKSKFIRGVGDRSLDIESAIDACIASVENEPNIARFSFQLGRALFSGQMYEDAFSFLEEAANNGYAPANYYLAEYYGKGLSPVEQHIDKSTKLYKLASRDEFLPATVVLKRFREELQNDMKQRQAEEREKLRIANAKFELDSAVKAIVAGDYENLRHGLAMRYVYGVLLQLYEVGGEICSRGLSHENLTEMYNIITERHARGYVKYRKDNQKKIGWALFDNTNTLLIEREDYNNRFDNLETVILNDMALLIGKYKCTGDIHDAFIDNGKKFILGSDAPPYNLVSKGFWNVCMREANVSKVSNERFCSCYLDRLRRDGVGRSKAKGLYTNFWATTIDIKNSSKKNENLVNRCSTPPKF